MLENDLKKYSSSFMSDSKWRKLFSVINNKTVSLNVAIWKLVNENEPMNGQLPFLEALGKDHVGDCGALNGPFDFKIIEWILLPSKVSGRPYDKAPLQHATQDVYELKNRLDNLGQFEYDISDEGIKIYGYKP